MLLINPTNQIITVQALHYLTLSLLIPPLLWFFAEPNTLIYEGGAANVGQTSVSHVAWLILLKVVLL